MLIPMVLPFAAAAPVPQPVLQAKPIYKNSRASLNARVEDLFRRLTPEEKMDLLTGTAFTTRPIPRLGVPAMAMADAGQGVRGGMEGTLGPATAFPSGIAMASTWDPELVGRIGKAIGLEALNKGTGVEVLLGPAVNIHRSPLGGRNGEYFSEDPFLAARLGVGYIKGMQSTGCAATIKHFAANNEEVDRFNVDVRVGERALREIYLPAFEAAVKDAGVWTVMTSYNKVNGKYASANRYLVTDVLKKGWGFDGMVMSDWGGVHETIGVVEAGNDLEMPGPGLLKKELIARALAKGQISQRAIDDNVRRILRTVIRVGLLDGPRRKPNGKIVDSPAHRKLTFEAAAKGIVLLKNQGNVLPLDRKRLKSVAVIGGPAQAMQVGAAGSPTVTPFYTVQPLDGIRKAVRAGTTVRYAQGLSSGSPIPPSAWRDGLQVEYFANRNLEGQPALVRSEPAMRRIGNGSPAPGLPDSQYSVRWTGKLTATKTGRTRFTISADDGCRLFIDGKAIISEWHTGGETDYSGAIDLVTGRTYDIRVEYFQAGGAAAFRLNWLTPGQARFGDAIAAARQSEVAVVCVSTMGQEGEGGDRPSMALPRDQDDLIQAVAAVNKRTVVVINNGTPVDMRAWVGRVPAIVETWFPGQEGGAALAAILFGDVNPSGKLPDTLAARREEYPDFGNFPGVRNVVKYEEEIYVGYRHFDKRKIGPLFPFGHGLSYTSFRYGKVAVSAPSANGTRTASVRITNTGRREGAEVVQLYVHVPKPKIDRPIRELKGFQKVSLAPGETKTVTIAVPPRSLAYCDVPGKRWKADAGSYEIEVGASSRDIRGKARFTLAKAFTEAIPGMSPQAVKAGEVDLAEFRPVTASSMENRPDLGNLGAGMTVDGDSGTRWSSAAGDPQWIAVDLGKPTRIARVELGWEAAYATSYSIQVSDDGQAWTGVYGTQDGQGGLETIEFTPVTTRYVRLMATKRATEFGISLFHFSVFGRRR